MILREAAFELGSDEHGFVIEGVAPARESMPVVPDNTLMKWWSEEDPDFTSFMVSTGSQWGPFAVAVRVHDREPEPADTWWEDVVAVSVVASDEIQIGEVVDGPQGEVPTEPGPHRMRVCSRGRTESAARDSAIPDDDAADDADEVALEHYLIEVWPAPPAVPAVERENSTYAREQKDPPAPVYPPEREAGLAAAWAIVRDLQDATGARDLPGQLDTVSVAMELPGTPVKLYNRVQYVFGWPPCSGGSGSPDPTSRRYHDATLPEYDRYEQVGHIVTTQVEATKPKRIVMRWNWMLPGPGPIDRLPLLLREDSTVTISVAPINGIGEEPRCLVRITHDGAPGAWKDDLEHLWRWHLVTQAARP